MGDGARARVDAASAGYHPREGDGFDAITDLDDALATLPAFAREVLAAPTVMIVTPDSAHVATDFAGRPGMRNYVDRRRADGVVVLSLADREIAGHEAIHVAQARASPAVREASVVRVVEEGRGLLAAVEGRDDEWTTWMRGRFRSGGTSGIPADWDRLVAEGGVPAAWGAIRSEGSLRGMGAVGTAAAAMAALAREAGSIDPDGRFGREVVAYRHQWDLSPLADLFADASSRSPQAAGHDDRVAGVDRMLAGLPTGPGDRVAVAVARMDVERALAGGGGGYADALAGIVGAVRQPGWGRDGARSGERGGRAGAEALATGFGRGGGARRLWMDGRMLRARLLAHGMDGGMAAALAEGNASRAGIRDRARTRSVRDDGRGAAM